MKRWLAIATLALLVAAPGRSAIAFDATATTSGTASSFVFDHTVTGSDTFICVKVGYDPTTTFPVTAVTYDGELLTELASLENGTDQGVSDWIGAGANTGTNPVTVLLSASVKCVVISTSYTGVNQAAPVGDNIHADVTGTAGAVTVTTVEDNSLVVGCASWEGSGVITVDGSQTERSNQGVAGGMPATRTKLAADDEAKTPAGAVAMDYSYTISNPAVICAYVLQPVAVAGSPTPTFTPTASPTPGLKTFMRPWPYMGPVYVADDDNVALLRMENNEVDEIGKYSWTNGATTPYSNTVFKENLYSLGPIDGATMRVESSTAITDIVKTIEFWLYVDWGLVGADQYCYATGVDFLIHLKASTTNVVFAVVVAGWSAEADLVDDAWSHIGVTFDTSDVILFINNANAISLAATFQPSNHTHIIGNQNSRNNSGDCWMDFVRLSSVVRTAFPTSE